MTQEDIIRMAREAKVPFGITAGNPDKEDLLRFARLIEAYVRGEIFKPDWNNYRQGLIDGATAEREACANLCWKNKDDNAFVNAYNGKRLDLLCADLIKARG